MSIRTTNKPMRQVTTIICLFAVILLLVLFRQSETLVERIYYDHIYQWICLLTRHLFNWIPFSIGDVIYTVVIMALLTGAFRLIRSLFIRQARKAGRLALRLVICLQVAWLWFYCFWGLNYYRPPAAKLLDLADTSYTIKDVATVTQRIIDSANTLRACLDTAELHQSNAGIYTDAAQAVEQLATTSPKFRVAWPRVKPSLFSHLLNYMGTSGYYNPFTSEAQMNSLMPIADKPFVACHEMGHQTGFAREDEANFAGFAAATGAQSRLLRYSAYFAGIEEFMRYIRRRDTAAHHALRLHISPLVYQDFKADSAYWVQFEGGAEVVSGLFFDKFLKANNQPHGLRTYNRMILLTMAYYRKRYRAW